jgi:hypothetical protein
VKAPLCWTLATIVFVFVFGVHCVNLGGSTSTASSSGFAEAQLACQGAAAHLQGCCPGFDPSLATFTCDTSMSITTPGCGGGGGGETMTRPSLSPSESSCVLAEDCDALVASGVCARAITRAAMSQVTNDTDASDGAADSGTFDADASDSADSAETDALTSDAATPEPPETGAPEADAGEAGVPDVPVCP